LSVLFFYFENKSYIICQLLTSLTLFASYRQVLLYLPVINKSYIICQLSTSLTLFASYRQALLYLSVIDKSYFICQLSTGLAVIWCVSTLMYLFSGFFGIPGYIFPLAMAGFMVLFLINPIHIFHHSSRMWLLRILVSRSM